MSPVISDPVLPRERKAGREKSKSKATNFLSFPVVLIIVCSIAALPPISSRLWAIDGDIHAHNDAIVSVIMAIAPYFLVAFAALGLFVFIRAGRPIEVDPDSQY